MANKKTTKRTAAIFAVIGALSLTGGVLAQSREDAHAEGRKLLYSADFENLNASATAGEIYGATHFAGANRSIEETSAAYIEAPYSFFDNGCQNGTLYLDSGRGVSSTDTDKTYTITMKIQPYGLVSNTTLGITGENNAAYNSVVILNADGTSSAANYGSEKYVNLVSATKDDAGWWTAEFTAQGTGSYIFFNFFMNTTDYATANAEKNTGLRLMNFTAKCGDAVVYDFGAPAGLSGEAAIFGASGFAGIANAKTTASGITGKSLKTVYDFFGTAEGGWQREPLYINENELNVNMEAGKKYVAQYDVRLFGRVNQAICIFRQGSNDTDSQVILKSDGSYQTVEYKDTKMFDNVSVACENGVFHVRVTLNGLGGLFKLETLMNSSDADGANAAKDTGLYFDNFAIYDVTDGDTDPVEPADPATFEYTKLFGQTFNAVDSSVSGSDAMFHASKFAGLSSGALTIDEQGIDGTKSLKGVYAFYDDGGWQKDNLYLDAGATGGTAEDKLYRISFDLKPFGEWDMVYVGFQTPAGKIDYLRLNADGTFAKEGDANIIVKHTVTYADGVFRVDAYMNGTGGYIFNFFNLHSGNPATANAENNTGVLLDNYVFAQKKEPEAPSLNKKAATYNAAAEKDFSTYTNLDSIAEVKFGETVLETTQYTFADGVLTIKESVMKGLPAGTYSLTVTDEKNTVVAAEINVINVKTGADYVADFADMPELTGDQDSKDMFFRSSFMDPGEQRVFTEDFDGNRTIKFVSTSVDSDDFTSMFQTNPQDGRLNMMTKDKWHTITADFKPVNASLLRLRCHIFDSGKDTDWWSMELDLAAKKRTDDNAQSKYVNFAVEELENGWYRVSVSFFFTGEEYSDAASAYVIYSSAKENADAVWYMDNFEADSELIPYFVDENEAGFDTATKKEAYRLVQLYDFTVTKVTAGDKQLTENTDYTVTATPVGTYRLAITKAFCEQYSAGDTVAVSVLTSKGNTLNFNLNIFDSTPSLPAETLTYDKAPKKDLAFDISLGGYALVAMKEVETAISDGVYYMDGDKLVLKQTYLKTLTNGAHVFTIETASGATGTFTVEISDSTPVIAAVTQYKKNSGALELAVETYGKEIVSVKLNNRVLQSGEYTYANGKLTIAESVMNSLVAGEYTLEAETVASAAGKIVVSDEPPVFADGEANAVKGSDFVLTVDVKNKTVISVSVDGLLLGEDDYTYENGTLTIKAAVLEEIAAGEKEVEIVTEGGKAVRTFTLSEAPKQEEKKKGCGGSVAAAGAAALSAAIAVAFAAGKKKRDESED